MPVFGGLSSARARFDIIRAQSDPFTYLQALIGTPSNPTFEEEWLDFKGNPRSDSDVKRIWSKALAGFANITDGLLIWGIDARKDPTTGRDVAGQLHLIPDPLAFKSRLRELQPDATNSPVMGVEVEAYVGPNCGPGFVVCYVPESAHKPHRAEFADKQWYYRTGTSFKPAEPGLLRALFYPQRSTLFDVELILECKFKEFAGERARVEAMLTLSSTLRIFGTATAKDVYVNMYGELPSLNMALAVSGSDWEFKGWTRVGFGFAARRPLHPGDECSVFYRADFMNPDSARKIGDRGYEVDFAMPALTFTVYATDQERQRFEFSTSRNKFSQRPGGATSTPIVLVHQRI